MKRPSSRISSEQKRSARVREIELRSGGRDLRRGARREPEIFEGLEQVVISGLPMKMPRGNVMHNQITLNTGRA